jgi:DNA invertase Pin-like site-specific DNA recombinase
MTTIATGTQNDLGSTVHTASIIAPKRAILYLRVSTKKQKEEGESLEHQEREARRYCEMHSIEIVDVIFEDESRFIHFTLRKGLAMVHTRHV